MRPRGTARAEPVELPPRPYVPPLAATASAALAAAALCMEAGWRQTVGGGDACWLLGALAAALVGSVIAALAPRRAHRLRRYARWALAGVLLGTVASGLNLAARGAGIKGFRNQSVSNLTFCISGDPSVSAYGAQLDATAVRADGSTVGAVSVSTDVPYEAGTTLRAIGRLQPFENDSWERNRFMSGQLANVQVVRVLEEDEERGTLLDRLRAAMLEVIAPRESAARALVAGIVCGRTTELNQSDANDAFARTGTSHLVAVSGSHLALVAALVVRLASFTRARPAARTAVLALLMGCYVIFTGGAPSAVRSLVMVVAGLLTRLGGRRAHGLSGLALAVIVLVLPQPGVVYDLGFQLSAASVLFIHLFSRYAEALLMRLHLSEGIAAALALTLVAQLATIPITLPVFGELSLIAPLANLLLGPLMTALLVCGLIITPIVAGIPLARALLALLVALAQLSIFTAEALSSVPYAAIAVDGASLGAAAWAPYIVAFIVYGCWRLPPVRILATMCVFASIVLVGNIVRMGWFAPPSVTVLDVGQADAILVRDGASTLLVDAGVDDEVIAALARNGVLWLDAVLITHWDRDHWGGLPAVLEAYPVGRLIVADGAADAVPPELAELDPPPLDEVAQGDRLQIGSFAAKVVWPAKRVEGTENADSLVLDLSYDARADELHMLLTGDSEAEQADEYAPAVGDIDVLKLGHHGSTASSDARMLAVLDPELAVASAGEGNAYGHPSKEAVEAVETAGSMFLCTIDVGDICLEPAASGVRVRTQRSAA